MNTINKTLIIISSLLIFIFSGCEEEVLDKPPRDIFSEVDVWSDQVLAQKYLNSIYGGLGGHVLTRAITGYYQSDCFTDIGTNNTYIPIHGGVMSPESMAPLSGMWESRYANIRMANIFIENIDQVNASEQSKKIMKGEAKYCRASFYNDLIQLWGGVPLITNVFKLDDDFMVPRNSYEEIVDWIVKELDEAKEMVPEEWPANEYGKITKGACVALKANVLLYANSKLHNPNADPPISGARGPLFDYTKNTWAQVAQAAKEVIDMPQYQLQEVTTWQDYRNIFLRPNSEVILAKPYHKDYPPKGQHLMYPLVPRSHGGWYHQQPMQQFVDEFQMENGKFIHDPESGYDPSVEGMYKNREMRFYADIMYHHSIFRTPVTFYVGGPQDMHLNSGYGINKYMDESVDPATESDEVPWIHLRLAEMHLTYAEAQYELGNEIDAREHVNIIRRRVNLPDINSSGLQLYNDIRHERKIELCFEDHRFYDMRRWVIADSVNNIDVGGIQWKLDNSGDDTFEYYTLYKRQFPAKMYYLPIPYAEIQKSDLEQNPGYD